MPALQVRDFPPVLYEELKAYATANHRSIAQQTVIAVEEMLASSLVPKRDERLFWDDKDQPIQQRTDTDLTLQTNMEMFAGCENSAMRKARIEKRKQLFDELSKISWSDKTITTDDIVAITREGRDYLTDRVWLSLNPSEAKDVDREDDSCDCA